MTKCIIYTNDAGEVSVIIPAPDSGLTIEQIAAKDVPGGVFFDVVDTDDIPTDRTFRNAWRKQGRTIAEDLAASKPIAHEKRRVARDEEMRPLDIRSTIPSQATAAEEARGALRTKYAQLQVAIDDAADVDALRGFVVNLKG